MKGRKESLVIRGGTLIDGTGGLPRTNEWLVIEGDRIRSLGVRPVESASRFEQDARLIDATGQWIMPGLIDTHVHLSFGFPAYPGIGQTTISAEFSTLRSTMNAQAVLRSGVTSISVPGGAWFIDVAVREAVELGLVEGPRIFCAGRAITVIGGAGDRHPYWVGTPDHAPSRLCHDLATMIAEVQRQGKHGVNFVKLLDTEWGEFQAFSDEQLAGIASEVHRRNLKCSIHSRGAGSTLAAARAGFDWIMHGDHATDEALDLMAERGIALLPTLTPLVLAIERLGRSGDGTGERDSLLRRLEACIESCRRARTRGVKLLAGSDTGSADWMHFGAYHSKEGEIFVRDVGLSPMEAIVSMTSANAMAVGLEGEVGVVAPGRRADLIVLRVDPAADITALQDPANLAAVIKAGRPVDLARGTSADVLSFNGFATEQSREG